MSKANRTYRIRTDINPADKFVNVDMSQHYDKFEILSLELNQTNSYRMMNSNTGVIVGRVLANEGFGIPNAKLSVFVKYDSGTDIESKLRYFYNFPLDTNDEGVRYNLLTDTVEDRCQQAVGSFPTKRFLLDNRDVIEVFDTYYSYTTRTNNAGDYMIYGVPVGQQIIHCDIDLSDIGVLSQTPRDMIYQGYDRNQFESPSKFNKSTNLASLPQIFSQNDSVYVYPFWGDTTSDSTAASVTRCDINISYKFEPTCVFMGSVITDTGQNAISKKCIPSKLGGKMSELTTGAGMIEMIRKTAGGGVEQISVKGNEVINDNGVWCYQIPMNLDYVMTDEYGNTVLSDNPNKGIPTRARVRFRVSMHENPADGVARKRARYLVPNNPRLVPEDYPEFSETREVDYEFGSATRDEDFRDLMWNNVYTVKNYIPRLQKAKFPNNWKFTGIKGVNHSGGKNHMPYNKLSIKFNFMYTFMCVLLKIVMTAIFIVNRLFSWMSILFYKLGRWCIDWAISLSKVKGWKAWAAAAFSVGLTLPLGRLLSRVFFSFYNHHISDVYFNTTHATNGYDGGDNDTGGDDGNSTPVVIPESYEEAKGIFLYPECNDMLDNTPADTLDRTVIRCISWINRTSVDGNNERNLWDFTNDGNLTGLGPVFLRLSMAFAQGVSLTGVCETDDDSGDEKTVKPGMAKEVENLYYNGYLNNDESKYYDCLKIFGQQDIMPIHEMYNCIENQLAQENEVVSFNFHNDWVNGVLYMPLWYRRIKPKRRFMFFTIKSKDQWCDANRYVMGLKSRPLKVYSNNVIKRTVGSDGVTISPLANDFPSQGELDDSVVSDETGVEILKVTQTEKNCYGYRCHKFGLSETPIANGLVLEKETMLGDHVYYYRPTYYDNVKNHDLVTLFATDIVLLGSLNGCDLHGIPQFFKILEGTSYQMPPDLVSIDYAYNETNQQSAETEENYINKGRSETEFTGADWGNIGYDQSKIPANGNTDVNENIYDNGGLFYGLNCFKSYTKPKSIINLERLCEIGVTLDEIQELDSVKKITQGIVPGNNMHEFNSVVAAPTLNLVPDGYVSYDEIYNPDYRSMFATMNGNFLKTHVNMETGLVEYDLTPNYLTNFDGSLYNIMKGGATQGYMIKQPTAKASYRNNYKLEMQDRNYTLFRFGDYPKMNGNKVYYYTNDDTVRRVGSDSVTSANKIPRYENSFYFYFGLIEGKTAIDEFNTNYYADCTVNEELEPEIDINHAGNDWCNPGEGGYIRFDCNLPIPLNLTITGLSDSNINDCYELTGIPTNKFYIGTDMGGDGDMAGYMYVPIYDGNGGTTPINGLAHGRYRITITDNNGDVHNESINFQNDDILTFDVDVTDFSIPNSALLQNVNTGLDMTDVYNAIADYGSGNSDRQFGGIITISNISVPEYTITVQPLFPLGEFEGCTVQRTYDSNAGQYRYNDIFGHGYLGVSGNGDIQVGVPFGGMEYVVRVSMICNTGEQFIDNDNVNQTVVTVGEGYLHMLINGIDYELLRNFNTGWKTSYMSRIQNDAECSFNGDDVRGWNNMSDIGVVEYNPTLSVESNLLDHRYTDDSVINTIGEQLVDDMQSDDSTYNWTKEYCIERAVWDSVADDNERKCQLINEVMSRRIDVTRRVIGAFRPNMYGKCEVSVTVNTSKLPVKYLLVNNLIKH